MSTSCLDKLFPLKGWETFKVFETTAIGKFHRGITHGKPGEYFTDIVNRAMDTRVNEYAKKDQLSLEHINR
jgi:hypothetical protein